MTYGDYLLIQRNPQGVMDGENADGSAQGPLLQSAELWIGGHSMFTHTGFGVFTDYTNAGEWFARIAAANGLDAAGQGNFGQIENLIDPGYGQYIQASTNSNYQYSNEGTFTPSTQFDQASPTHFVTMLSNFVQYDAGWYPDYTPSDPARRLTETLTLLDNVYAVHGASEFILFEHQPTFDPFDGGDITPTETAWNDYIAVTQGAWHQNHLGWQTSVNNPANGRAYTARLCPAGACIADLLAERNGDHNYLAGIQFNELHSDAAPHGTEWFYFLEGLVTFITVFGIAPSFSSFTVPAGATQMAASISNGDPAAQILANADTIAAFFKTRLDFYDANSQGVYSS